MENKKTGKAEEILRDLGRTIDELIRKAGDSSGDMKEDIKSRVEELKKNRDTLEKDLNRFREDHSGNFERLEKSVQRAADEIKQVLQDFFRKRPGNKK